MLLVDAREFFILLRDWWRTIIEVRELGSVIDVKLEQEENALEPIEVRESVSVIDVKLEQLENVSSDIILVFECILQVVIVLSWISIKARWGFILFPK